MPAKYQYRQVGLASYVLSYTAEYPSADAGPSMAGHNDNVGLVLGRGIENTLRRDIGEYAGLNRQPGKHRQLGQASEVPLSLPVVLHDSERSHIRNEGRAIVDRRRQNLNQYQL